MSQARPQPSSMLSRFTVSSPLQLELDAKANETIATTPRTWWLRGYMRAITITEHKAEAGNEDSTYSFHLCQFDLKTGKKTLLFSKPLANIDTRRAVIIDRATIHESINFNWLHETIVSAHFSEDDVVVARCALHSPTKRTRYNLKGEEIPLDNKENKESGASLSGYPTPRGWAFIKCPEPYAAATIKSIKATNIDFHFDGFICLHANPDKSYRIDRMQYYNAQQKRLEFCELSSMQSMLDFNSYLRHTAQDATCFFLDGSLYKENGMLYNQPGKDMPQLAANFIDKRIPACIPPGVRNIIIGYALDENTLRDLAIPEMENHAQTANRAYLKAVTHLRQHVTPFSREMLLTNPLADQLNKLEQRIKSGNVQEMKQFCDEFTPVLKKAHAFCEKIKDPKTLALLGELKAEQTLGDKIAAFVNQQDIAVKVTEESLFPPAVIKPLGKS